MPRIKRNKPGSFVETWMDPESVIRSEVSQTETNEYPIRVHKGGIKENSAVGTICRAEKETQT